MFKGHTQPILVVDLIIEVQRISMDFHVHCSVRSHWAQGRIEHDSPCVTFKRHQWLWTEIFDVVEALMDGWTTLLLYLRSRSALLVFTSWAPMRQMSSKASQRRWNVASRSDSWTPPWASDPVQPRSASLHHHFPTNWHAASMAFRIAKYGFEWQWY